MSEPTDLGYGRGAQALFFVVPAVLGVALGLGLWALLGWLLGLPWIPLRGPLELLDSISDRVALPVLLGLGLIAGAIFGAYALRDELFLSVGDDQVRLRRGDADRRVARTSTKAVFLNGKDLVLLAADGNELARERTDQKAAALAEAFGLPDGAGALLRLRGRALEKARAAEDARDLHADLINLGVVVRDEGGKQYWRLADRPLEA